MMLSNAPVPIEQPRETPLWSRWHRRLGPRGLILLAVVVIAAGLALNWSWLVAIGLAPIILAVLPCAVMCALGLCMMSRSGGSCAGSGPADKSQTAAPRLPGDERSRS
jgi:hypothetical protein